MIDASGARFVAPLRNAPDRNEQGGGDKKSGEPENPSV